MQAPHLLPGYWYLSLGQEVWGLQQLGLSRFEIYEMVKEEMNCIPITLPKDLLRAGRTWYVMVDRPNVALEVVARLNPKKLILLSAFVPQDRKAYLEMLDWAAYAPLTQIKKVLYGKT